MFKRVTVIWLVLVIATTASGLLGTGYGFHDKPANLEITAAVLAIAFAKARFVILDFMEARGGPLAVRLIGEFWVVGAFAAILGLYASM